MIETLEQAKAEAARRWYALGGWAEEEEVFYGEESRWNRRVGYRVHDGVGPRQVVLGRADTWDKAFLSADRCLERLERLEREAKEMPSRPRPGDKAVEKGGFPTVEMFGG